VAHHVVEGSGKGRHLLVFESKEPMWAYMVGRFRELSDEAIGEAGRFSAALSGGKTPEGLYLEIARKGQDMAWKSTHIFLVDERFVPFSDERSNFGMIRRTLLDRVPIPGANAHPIETERADPPASAREYEAALRGFFASAEGNIPKFDMILLGLGEDGHTASLFPGLADGCAEKQLVRGVEAAGERVARITLTLPVINRGRTVFFLVTGKGKAEIVRRVVREREPGLPASLVEPEGGALFFVCDRDAASLLEEGAGKARTA